MSLDAGMYIQGIRTKDTEVFQELVTNNMDITVLTETEKKEEENEIKGEYIYFCSRVDTKKSKSGSLHCYQKEVPEKH